MLCYLDLTLADVDLDNTGEHDPDANDPDKEEEQILSDDEEDEEEE